MPGTTVDVLHLLLGFRLNWTECLHVHVDSPLQLKKTAIFSVLVSSESVWRGDTRPLVKNMPVQNFFIGRPIEQAIPLTS